MNGKFLNVIIVILMVGVIGLAAYIFVFDEKKQIESITLNNNNINLMVGEQQALIASVKPEDIDYELIWESDNMNVVSVSNGVITGKASGDATITVHDKENKTRDKCFVSVKEKEIEDISLSTSSIEMMVGETSQINATITPPEMVNEKLTWMSDDSSIATVDENGLVRGVGAGSTFIRVKANIIERVCTVKVNDIPLPTMAPSIVITPTPMVIITPGPVTPTSIPQVTATPKVTKTPTITVTPKVTKTPTVTATPKVTKTPTPTSSSSGKLEIHFINAGGYYDDAILIKSSKATIFMDGGRGKEAVVKYLKNLDIKKIDYVIGSHTEYDHINAQGEVIKQFDVKHALYPNDIFKCGCACDATDVGEVNKALRSKNMTPEVQSVPSKLTIGDMTLYFISPFKVQCNKNNNSFIFILQYGNNKFMFTGDQDSDLNNVNQLVDNAKSLGLSGIESNMLKYPHHGNQGLSDTFLDKLKAKYVIVPNVNACHTPSQVSMGKLNNHNMKVYRQCESSTGNILLTSDGTNIKIKMDV